VLGAPTKASDISDMRELGYFSGKTNSRTFIPYVARSCAPGQRFCFWARQEAGFAAFFPAGLRVRADVARVYKAANGIQAFAREAIRREVS